MKKTTIITSAILAILAIVYFSLPKYAQRALIYQKVGIEDYSLFHNREVSTGDKQEWQTNPISSELELNNETLQKFNELQTIAYLILKDDKIIFEQYWDGFDANSLTNSFSMSKSIIGLLIGAAIDDGYISNVNQPVSDFITEFNTVPNKNLKIKDVLTMSSGLNWDESYGSLFSTTTEAYYGTDIKKLIYSLEVVEEPGKVFKYLSGNTQLLALVVERATGKKVGDYAAEKFWKPMGAVNTALWCLDNEDGTEKAYCCFNSNARDFARWGYLALNSGVWKNDTLISPQYVNESLAPASHLTNTDGKPVNYYGYQWWIQQLDGNNVPYMRGILGQYVFVIPNENAVVVRLGHKRSTEYTNYHPNDTYLYLETAKTLLNNFNSLANK
ncbi:MAG: serine hydrolase [Salinivirgaceae bacterium]|jgi:CubicO group peptidase (beta-lactamase class C family)|nr:serine hydrolase [Salinivirgaceae bacterium]